MPRTRPVAYPETCYAVPVPPDLSRPEERRRLSVGALKAFFKTDYRGASRLLVGSISDKILRGSHLPLLLVHPGVVTA